MWVPPRAGSIFDTVFVFSFIVRGCRRDWCQEEGYNPYDFEAASSAGDHFHFCQLFFEQAPILP